MLYDKILGPDNSPTTCLYILYLQHTVYKWSCGMDRDVTKVLQCIQLVQKATKKR